MDNLTEYIKFKSGNIPLILSVPHGGELECKNIPKRKNGVLGIDKNTVDLTQNLIESIQLLSEKKNMIKKCPSYVISNVRRYKIDLNRPEIEAFRPESLLAQRIYSFYHKKIRELIDENLKIFNFSLLLDIHGFERHKRPSGFRDVDIILGTRNLKSISAAPIHKKDWDKTIRGKIIKKYLDLGIPIAPGGLNVKEWVLTGGFITIAYGATQISKSQAIQVEFSDRIRILDNELKVNAIRALAEILSHYIELMLESRRLK